MAKNIGFKVRPVKEMEIFYGQDLVSGVKQTRTLPVSGSSKIWSGEVIFSSSVTSGDDFHAGTKPLPGYVDGEPNASVWSRGTISATTGAEGYVTSGIPHFAVTDSDRFDVEASGKLLALVGTDTFQLGTCFYDHSKTYSDGDALYIVQVSASTAIPEFTDVAELGTSKINLLTNALPAAADIASGTKVDVVRVGYVVDGVIELKGNVEVDDAASGGLDLNGYTGNSAMSPNPAVVGGPALWTEATKSDTMLKFTTNFGIVTVTGTKNG